MHATAVPTGLRLVWDIRRIGRASPAALAGRRRVRLADLVTFARTHSPYYRRLYRDLPERIEDVRGLPPVTKAGLMACFDDWVTDPLVTRAGVEAFIADPSRVGQWYRGRYLVWTTSGTTGVPAILLQDRRAQDVLAALCVLRGGLVWLEARHLRRLVRRRGHAALVLATTGHAMAVSLAEHARRSGHWVARAIDILPVHQPLTALVRRLNAIKPALLIGYATAIQLLADEQAAGRLHIDPVLVVTVAEGLTTTARQAAAAAFGARIADVYGASEAGVIALSCRRGRLHVNADWVILEAVDAAYQPVSAGQPSHTVLLTNLANRIQPVIRYDLGDSVTVSPTPCPCGNPLPVIFVEGRTNDILAFQTPTGETVRLLPLAIGAVVEETPGVDQFQVLQTAPARLRVRLSVRSGADPGRVWQAVDHRLRAYLAEQGLPDVQIERAAEPPQRDTRSGKFRQVWLAPSG
jgi:phenylacetate-CoA ligase